MRGASESLDPKNIVALEGILLRKAECQATICMVYVVGAKWLQSAG